MESSSASPRLADTPIFPFQHLLDLALFQLVQLIGRHDHRAAGTLEPVAHGHIVGGRIVPRVHDQHTQRNEVGLGEIALHQLSPPVALLLGHLGVAVPRQVGEVNFPVDVEIVDLIGLAGGGAHAGKILPPQQPVDHGGLPHIAATGKRDLWFSVTDKGTCLYSRQHEFRLVKVDRHSAPPVVPVPPWR